MATETTYDLLIKGGDVVDPGSGYSGQLDVAVKDELQRDVRRTE